MQTTTSDKTDAAYTFSEYEITCLLEGVRYNETSDDNGCSDEFIAEAIRLAELAGYRPAELQRSVEWTVVYNWYSRIVGSVDFQWAAADDRSVDGIIVGPAAEGGWAVHAGQHRIIAGIIAGRPVPAESMTLLSVCDRTKGWSAAPAVYDFWSGFGA